MSISNAPLILPERDRIDLWQASMDVDDGLLLQLAGLLEEGERQKAASIKLEPPRRRFIASRAILRSILSRYLGMLPGEIPFQFNPHGKPYLSLPPGTPDMSFNISHSGGLCLAAVTRSRAVGIDVERMREDIAFEAMARRFFSEEECAAIMSQPPPLQKAAFYRCWTRREAYVKARGESMALMLSKVAVSVEDGEPARVIWCSSHPGDPACYTLTDLDAGPGFAACIAYEGKDARLSPRPFSPP
jgi:4'-phosphopantetheinyl transferase